MGGNCISKFGSRKCVRRNEYQISSPQHQALANPLIIQQIFEHLDLPSLRNARLVCCLWGREGSKILYKFNIVNWIATIYFWKKSYNHYTTFLQSFIQRCKICYTLNLSFQKPAFVHVWEDVGQMLDSEEKEFNLQRYYAYRYNFDREDKNVKKMVLFVTLVGPFVRELRLEMTLTSIGDADLLTSVLSWMPNLSKIALDIVAVEEIGLLSLPKDQLFPSSVHTLGMRWHQIHDFPEKVGLPGAMQFMMAVSNSNIKFLDFLSWMSSWVGLESAWGTTVWLEAIRTIYEQDETSFHNLQGIREVACSNVKINFLATFPKQLQNLTLLSLMEDTEHDFIDFLQLESVLERHAPTLTTLSLCCGSNMNSIRLDHVTMPHLRRLEFSFPFLLMEGVKVKEDYLKLMDSISIRSLFLGGVDDLKQHFPSLTTIGVFMDEDQIGNLNGFWNYIFPAKEEILRNSELQNQNCFHQIKELNVSLICDCGHKMLTRLFSLFPSLNVLRHSRSITTEWKSRRTTWKNCSTCIHKHNADDVISILTGTRTPWNDQVVLIPDIPQMKRNCSIDVWKDPWIWR